MSKTKDLRKKSVDLIDFSKSRRITADSTYGGTYTFHSLIQLGSCATQCTAFPGIRLVAKTVKGVFLIVVRKKHIWPATNPVSIMIATSDKSTSLCHFDLKRHQTSHY
jgi:hypothetical protein